MTGRWASTSFDENARMVETFRREREVERDANESMLRDQNLQNGIRNFDGETTASDGGDMPIRGSTPRKAVNPSLRYLLSTQ
jgi:hypothetical protein